MAAYPLACCYPGQFSAGSMTVYAAKVSRRLDAICLRLGEHPGKIAIGEIVDLLGPSSLGLTILLLALLSLVPLPGPFGVVFGLLIVLTAIQFSLGERRLRVPRILYRVSLSRRFVNLAIEKGQPAVRWIEALVSPRRWLPLSGRRARAALVVPLVALALILAVPIPLGNFGPAASLIAFSIGILFRDGLIILVGLAMSIAAFAWTAILVVFGSVLASQFSVLIGWF